MGKQSEDVCTMLPLTSEGIWAEEDEYSVDVMEGNMWLKHAELGITSSFSFTF